MSEEWIVCTADIRNRIHEAGIFRTDERIVLTTKSCVLLEHFTGKAYSYRMVDLHTLKAKRLFSRPTPLNEAGYRRAIEKMAAQSEGETTFVQDGNSRAGELLAHIFYDILPEYGLVLRENQLSLSLAMLEAMEKEKVALCEAGVGTGKTHAYLMAAVIYRLFHREGQPVVISTSTIALQKALTEEYIPQISGILLEHRIIEEPLTFAVRKGKNHYACDSRVKTYLSSIRHNNRPEDGKLIEVLTALFVGASSLDLDGQPLTDYVKERICVEDCRNICVFSSVCRYRTFLRKSNQEKMDFQIANHNLVLADILSRKGGRNRLLPEHGILIFDEAHKLSEAARQMYGVSFENVELERVAASIIRAGAGRPEKRGAISLCEEMLELNTALFENLKKFDNFDVYGHLDYVVRYGPEKDRGYCYETYSDLFDRILELLLEKGKGLELNTGGISDGMRDVHPCREVLRRYRQKGGEIITIGSDAHDPAEIAAHFHRAEEVLQECGFRYYTVFENRQPEFKRF